jgi:hypothetical protein
VGNLCWPRCVRSDTAERDGFVKVGGLFPAAVLFHDLRGGEGEATSS